MKEEVYTLQGGEKGKQRLNILNKLYNPVTQQFLTKNGLQPGMRVLEVGCGTGEMACWIAQQVGPHGQVVAVDTDIKQIELARQQADSLGLNNIVFLQKSIYELDSTLGHFDITFTRWVIGHLINPKKGLTALYDRLKSGGKMINISPHLDSEFAYPESVALANWSQLWTKILKTHGKDIQLGYKLPQLMKEVGCRALSIELFQPVLSTPEEKINFFLNIEEAKEFALKASIISEIDLQKLLGQLQQLSHQDHFIGSFRNVHVCGMKNILQLRNEVCYQILTILAGHFNRNLFNLFVQLDKAVLLKIFEYIDLPSFAGSKKSAQNCAEFMYDNINEIRARLINQQSIKMVEHQEDGVITSRFRFFNQYPSENKLLDKNALVHTSATRLRARL